MLVHIVSCETPPEVYEESPAQPPEILAGWDIVEGRINSIFDEGAQSIGSVDGREATIVFWGNSITEDGYYVEAIENYLMSAWSDEIPSLRFYNAGTGGNSFATGLFRFDTEILLNDPDVVIVEFGINDAAYSPFNEQRFAWFKEHAEQAIKRLTLETRARVIVLSPSYYDAYAKLIAGHPASKIRPYYNDVLGIYAAAARAIVDKYGAEYVDIRTPMEQITAKMRLKDPLFTMVPDGIHPDRTGGFVMACKILEQLLDGRSLKVLQGDPLRHCDVQQEETCQERLSPTRFSGYMHRIPYPMDLETLRLMEWILDEEIFNDVVFRLQGTEPDAIYSMSVNGVYVGQYKGDDLSAGISVGLPLFDVWMADTADLLRLTDRRRRFIRSEIRLATHKPKGIKDVEVRDQAYLDLFYEQLPEYKEADMWLNSFSIISKIRAHLDVIVERVDAGSVR